MFRDVIPHQMFDVLLEAVDEKCKVEDAQRRRLAAMEELAVGAGLTDTSAALVSVTLTAARSEIVNGILQDVCAQLREPQPRVHGQIPQKA